jgi:transposase
MSRRRQHRLWTAEEKRSICLQTRAPGVSVAQVARRYALNSNLIFKWLRDPRFAPAAGEAEAAAVGPVFLPVEVRSEPAPASMAAADPAGDIEILLTCGHRVTVRGSFDGEALARLLQGLVSP